MTKKQIAAVAAVSAAVALALLYQTFMRYDYTTNPHNGVVMSRIDRLTGTVCPRSCLYPQAVATPVVVPSDFVPVTQPASRAR